MLNYFTRPNNIFSQICATTKNKDQCSIALQFASRAFAGNIPEELESLVRTAVQIASGETKSNIADKRRREDQAENNEDKHGGIESLVGATSDRFLRYHSYHVNYFLHHFIN